MGPLSYWECAAFLAIILAAALAGAADYGRWAAVPRFALATIALAGLAWVVSFATEQLGEHFGPGTTGMLQSTLGNLPELFVVIFALEKGELIVAQTAIIGCTCKPSIATEARDCGALAHGVSTGAGTRGRANCLA